jgi:hypothetical protein
MTKTVGGSTNEFQAPISEDPPPTAIDGSYLVGELELPAPLGSSKRVAISLVTDRSCKQLFDPTEKVDSGFRL